ncbi:MAG: TlyA family RNA methyltransferase, partial [Fusobacteriaceae bacterium]|nr:TlyA family RNA methyltransferase [Fusobacteriaceae bacterium]
KLQKAIRVFGLDLRGAAVLDVGASTGGFTDCALRHGAAFVYAVDVGTNQLDYRLRTDPRVKSIENTHISRLTPADLDDRVMDFITADLSFISVRTVVGDLLAFTGENAKLVILIKPQFEAAKDQVEPGGLVKKIDVHSAILHDIITVYRKNGLYLENLAVSPIRGAKGNTEYLALFTRDPAKGNQIDIDRIISPEVNSEVKNHASHH